MFLLKLSQNGPAKKIGIFDREGIDTYLKNFHGEDGVTITEEEGDRFADFYLWVESCAPDRLPYSCSYQAREVQINTAFANIPRRW